MVTLTCKSLMNNMTYRTRNILIFIIVFVFCLAVGLTITILVNKEKKEAEELERYYSARESELSELKRERNSLSLELSTIDDNLNGIGYNLGSAIILITDPSSYFLDDIYPSLNSNRYSAIINIGANYFINNNRFSS